MGATDNAPTREQLAAGLRQLVAVGRAIHETIRESGPEGAPESAIHLALAERGYSDRIAAEVIEALVSGGLVRRQHHALVAVAK